VVEYQRPLLREVVEELKKSEKREKTLDKVNRIRGNVVAASG
jgi:hypothetical protein